VYSLLPPPHDWRRDINWDDVYDHAKAVLTPVTPGLCTPGRGGLRRHRQHQWRRQLLAPDAEALRPHRHGRRPREHTQLAGAAQPDADQPVIRRLAARRSSRRSRSHWAAAASNRALA
jgi:hypothetical protein